MSVLGIGLVLDQKKVFVLSFLLTCTEFDEKFFLLVENIVGFMHEGSQIVEVKALGVKKGFDGIQSQS